MKSFLTLRREAESDAAALDALMIEAQAAARTLSPANHAMRRAGPGEKFWQFRDYAPGDRIQDIDWRRSGRGDRVYIREKERQSAKIAIFWCSRATSMDFHSGGASHSKARAAKILTLALGLLALRGGEQIAFAGGKPGASDKALRCLGENLLVEGHTSLTLPLSLAASLPPKPLLTVVSDFLNPVEDIEKFFSSLASRTKETIVLQVLDPAEIDLPYNGSKIFQSCVSAPKIFIEDVASIRKNYREKIENHILALSNLCRRYGWVYVLHKTGEPIKSTLQNIVQTCGQFQ